MGGEIRIRRSKGPLTEKEKAHENRITFHLRDGDAMELGCV